jgi:hypothetical protein
MSNMQQRLAAIALALKYPNREYTRKAQAVLKGLDYWRAKYQQEYGACPEPQLTAQAKLRRKKHYMEMGSKGGKVRAKSRKRR